MSIRMKRSLKSVLIVANLMALIGISGCSKKSAKAEECYNLTAGNYGVGGNVGSPLYAIAQHDGIFDKYNRASSTSSSCNSLLFTNSDC